MSAALLPSVDEMMAMLPQSCATAAPATEASKRPSNAELIH